MGDVLESGTVLRRFVIVMLGALGSPPFGAKQSPQPALRFTSHGVAGRKSQFSAASWRRIGRGFVIRCFRTSKPTILVWKSSAPDRFAIRASSRSRRPSRRR